MGHEITREYYFNDSGAQVEKLGLSVLAITKGEPVPDDGYHGEYVKDIAAELPPTSPRRPSAEPDRAGWIVGEWASEQIRAGIEASLERLGVHFDVWKTRGLAA